MPKCAPYLLLQVRQTAVSYDGSTVLAACEDGTIQRWDLVQIGKQHSQNDEVNTEMLGVTR